MTYLVPSAVLIYLNILVFFYELRFLWILLLFFNDDANILQIFALFMQLGIHTHKTQFLKQFEFSKVVLVIRRYKKNNDPYSKCNVQTTKSLRIGTLFIFLIYDGWTYYRLLVSEPKKIFANHSSNYLNVYKTRTLKKC